MLNCVPSPSLDLLQAGRLQQKKTSMAGIFISLPYLYFLLSCPQISSLFWRGSGQERGRKRCYEELSGPNDCLNMRYPLLSLSSLPLPLALTTPPNTCSPPHLLQFPWLRYESIPCWLYFVVGPNIKMIM